MKFVQFSTKIFKIPQTGHAIPYSNLFTDQCWKFFNLEATENNENKTNSSLLGYLIVSAKRAHEPFAQRSGNHETYILARETVEDWNQDAL